MAELQELTAQTPSKDKDKPIRGIRVVYVDIDCSSHGKLSDHSDQHNKEWERQLEESLSPALEVGTITGLDINTGALTVIWDCGVTKDYTYKEWENLRVYGLGSAGSCYINANKGVGGVCVCVCGRKAASKGHCSRQ